MIHKWTNTNTNTNTNELIQKELSWIDTKKERVKLHR